LFSYSFVATNMGSGDNTTYRVIPEERAIFWEVIVSVIVRRKNSCHHMSNFELLPVRAVRNSSRNSVRYFFLGGGLNEERSLQKKGGYTIRISGSHSSCCYPRKEI
jgi:hypothetical protein